MPRLCFAHTPIGTRVLTLPQTLTMLPYVHCVAGVDVQETTSEYRRVLSAVEDATQEGEDLPPFPAAHLIAALDAAEKVQSYLVGDRRRP